jgi:hypothetical protein
MKAQYTPPQYQLKAFNCPHCGAYANQMWHPAYHRGETGGFSQLLDLYFSQCAHCNVMAIWLNEKMIEPDMGNAPLPNQDLPQDIKDDYIEARSILNKSPRGAAALLRLAIQKLCRELGGNGKNINNDIATLVSQGLDKRIQKSLDYVRVIGNNSVHPGQIDLKDNQEVALHLFNLINIIADRMITQPKHIDNLYNSLPAEQLAAIQKRDNIEEENK